MPCCKTPIPVTSLLAPENNDPRDGSTNLPVCTRIQFKLSDWHQSLESHVISTGRMPFNGTVNLETIDCCGMAASELPLLYTFDDLAALERFTNPRSCASIRLLFRTPAMCLLCSPPPRW
jgi:hypothetical protein